MTIEKAIYIKNTEEKVTKRILIAFKKNRIPFTRKQRPNTEAFKKTPLNQR